MEGHIELGERLIGDRLSKDGQTRVTVNVRESAIAHMASRGRLNASQVEAGERFRRLCELSAIGRMGSVDLDGGGGGGRGIGDPITDSVVRASRELSDALRALGKQQSSIMVAIVGEGLLIEDMAKRYAQAGGIVSGRRAEGYVTGTLVDALDELVRLWRLEAIGKPKIKAGTYKRAGKNVEVEDDIVSSGPIEMTGPSREVSVGRFGDIEVREVVPVDRGPLTVHATGTAQDQFRRSRKR